MNYQDILVVIPFVAFSYLGFRAKWHVSTGEYWIWNILIGVPFYFLAVLDASAFPVFFLIAGLFLSYLHGARLRTITKRLVFSLLAGLPLLGLPFVVFALFRKTPPAMESSPSQPNQQTE